MSCCGKKRAQWAAEADRSASNRNTLMDMKSDPHDTIAAEQSFEYTGAFSKAIVGIVTRQPYYFAGPGARVAVDPADAPALRGESDLRRVGGGSVGMQG